MCCVSWDNWCPVQHCLLMAPPSFLHLWLSSSILGRGVFSSLSAMRVHPFLLSVQVFVLSSASRLFLMHMPFSVMFSENVSPFSWQSAPLWYLFPHSIIARSVYTFPLFFSAMPPFTSFTLPVSTNPCELFCKQCIPGPQSQPLCQSQSLICIFRPFVVSVTIGMLGFKSDTCFLADP